MNDQRFENINKSPAVLSNVKISEAPSFKRFVKRDGLYYHQLFQNKLECWADYDPLKSIKSLSKTHCMVNIGSNKRFKEDIKLDLTPEYDAQRV